MAWSNTLPSGWRISYGNSTPSWHNSPDFVTLNASTDTPTANGSYA